jgi:hypothetical protein
MKKGLVALGVVLVAGGAGVYFFYFAPRMQHQAEREEHRQALEHELAPLTAMMKAPDGATPCETAFNAFSAYDTTAKAQGGARPWVELPDRAGFLTRCGTLSQQEQQCLQPRYQARQHDVCDPLLEGIKNRKVLYEPVGHATKASGVSEPPPPKP